METMAAVTVIVGRDKNSQFLVPHTGDQYITVIADA